MSVVVFWLGVTTVLYTYVGYPLLVAFVGWRASPLRRARRGSPFVSVVIAAFNEADCIGAKLDSTLEQGYPHDRLEVIVVSDGSTDATDALVASHPDHRVHLLRQEPRAGKSAALNRAVAVARGDILVFTDANALFAPDSLDRLAAAFDDPRVGLVSGQGRYRGSASEDARVVSNGYVGYEARLKSGEGALGFLASADGAIYALRRSLYRELEPAEVNDLLHPIQAALAGYVSRFEPDAFTLEPPSSGAPQELRRHVRIIGQGVHLLRAWLPPLVAARQWRAVWCLVSHRVLRWTSSLPLAAAFVASAALLDRGGIYALAFLVQLAFYLTALGGLVAERLGASVGRLAIPYYFCVVTAAGLAGVVRGLRGGADAVWRPTSQAPSVERAA